MSLKVQVAIQGGGAKLPHLLAATKCFREASKPSATRGDVPILQVTRTAGTSAGAIAATLLAGDGDFDTAISYMNTEGETHLKSAQRRLPKLESKADWFKAAAIASFGESLYDSESLRMFIMGLLKAAFGNVPEKISDVEKINGTNLFITASDLRYGHGHQFGPNDALLDSIMHSCAFPVAFRNYRSLRDTSYVDGGLCDNLPAEILLLDQSYGRVFAISPNSISENAENRTAPHPKNLLNYISTLFSASINHNVSRTKKIVGNSSLITFDSDLETFSFRDAMHISPKSADVSAIFSQAERQILRYAKICSLANVNQNLFDVGVSDSKELMKTIGRVVDNLFAKDSIAPMTASFTAVADSLLPTEKDKYISPDIFTNTFEFKLKRKISIIKFKCKSDGNFLTSMPLVWSFKSIDRNESFAGEIAPYLEEHEIPSDTEHRFALFLKTPIEPTNSDERFIFEYKFAAENSFKGLLSAERCDYLEWTNGQGTTVPSCNLILLVPNQFGYELRPELSQDTRLPSNQLDKLEIASSLIGIHTVGYRYYGVRVSDLPPNFRVQVDFRHGRLLASGS